MPMVIVRAPLKDLAGGNGEVVLEGTSVREVLRALERAWPKTTGWVLDDQGRVRRHVNVFRNGEQVREDAAVGPDDRLHVLPSISGGAS
jgi:molybdopterin converting factor small subunit